MKKIDENKSSLRFVASSKREKSKSSLHFVTSSKRGQTGLTLNWFSATIIILFLLIIFWVVLLLFISGKKVTGNESSINIPANENNLETQRLLYSFLNSPIRMGEKERTIRESFLILGKSYSESNTQELSDSFLNDPNMDIINEELKKSFFSKQGLSKEEFDSTIKNYFSDACLEYVLVTPLGYYLRMDGKEETGENLEDLSKGEEIIELKLARFYSWSIADFYFGNSKFQIKLKSRRIC
jgi:hypothetical protein